MARQAMPALRTADALDQSSATEQDQYLVEVSFVDSLTQRDIVALNGSFADALRQIKQRAQTVFAFARDAHRW